MQSCSQQILEHIISGGLGVAQCASVAVSELMISGVVAVTK